jgi:hypothetical protein
MEGAIDIRVERTTDQQAQERPQVTVIVRALGLLGIGFVIGICAGIWLGFGAKAIAIAAHCW